jgi:hypothetical protein
VKAYVVFDDARVNYSRYSNVLFTAPSSGEYAISAGFRGDQYGDSANVNVISNASLLFNSYISGVGQTASYSGTVSLRAGQTIDFAVINPTGYWNTGLSASVTHMASVPELSTLLGFGGMLTAGGFVLLRRRKPNHNTV